MLTQTLQALTARYASAYAPLRSDNLQMPRGFSGALIIRIETSAGPYCVRGWPPGSLPAERILGLHRLLGFVFARGVREVAVPVPALTGETLVSWRGRDWQLEPWMPGVADFWQNPSPARLQHAMARLAALHQALESYEDTGSAGQWFFHREAAPSPAVAERLNILRDWQQRKIHRLADHLKGFHDKSLRDLAAEFISRFHSSHAIVAAQLELLSRLSFRLQPCLRDVWHDHVLFTGDEVTGLIDATACRGENIVTDLARLLGSLLGDDPDRWATAVQAYENHNRPLEAHEKALLQALDQSGVLLSAMLWMERLIIKSEIPRDRSNIWQRLEAFRKRLETLEKFLSRTSWQ